MQIRRENWSKRHSNEPDKELLPMSDEPALFYREMVEAGILGIIQSSPIPIRVLYDRNNIANMSFREPAHRFPILNWMSTSIKRFTRWPRSVVTSSWSLTSGTIGKWDR